MYCVHLLFRLSAHNTLLTSLSLINVISLEAMASIKHTIQEQLNWSEARSTLSRLCSHTLPWRAKIQIELYLSSTITQYYSITEAVGRYLELRLYNDGGKQTYTNLFVYVGMISLLLALKNLFCSNSETGCMKAYPIVVLLRIVAKCSLQLQVFRPSFYRVVTRHMKLTCASHIQNDCLKFCLLSM